MDDGLLAALDAICEATSRSPETSVLVIIDDPEHGRGGFVHVPPGAGESITVMGSLGVVALKGTLRQQRDLFDAIAMFLLAPDAAEA